MRRRGVIDDEAFFRKHPEVQPLSVVATQKIFHKKKPIVAERPPKHHTLPHRGQSIKEIAADTGKPVGLLVAAQRASEKEEYKTPLQQVHALRERKRIEAAQHPIVHASIPTALHGHNLPSPMPRPQNTIGNTTLEVPGRSTHFTFDCATRGVKLSNEHTLQTLNALTQSAKVAILKGCHPASAQARKLAKKKYKPPKKITDLPGVMRRGACRLQPSLVDQQSGPNLANEADPTSIEVPGGNEPHPGVVRMRGQHIIGMRDEREEQRIVDAPAVLVNSDGLQFTEQQSEGESEFFDMEEISTDEMLQEISTGEMLQLTELALSDEAEYLNSLRPVPEADSYLDEPVVREIRQDNAFYLDEAEKARFLSWLFAVATYDRLADVLQREHHEQILNDDDEYYSADEFDETELELLATDIIQMQQKQEDRGTQTQTDNEDLARATAAFNQRVSLQQAILLGVNLTVVDDSAAMLELQVLQDEIQKLEELLEKAKGPGSSTADATQQTSAEIQIKLLRLQAQVVRLQGATRTEMETQTRITGNSLGILSIESLDFALREGVRADEAQEEVERLQEMVKTLTSQLNLMEATDDQEKEELLQNIEDYKNQISSFLLNEQDSERRHQQELHDVIKIHKEQANNLLRNQKALYYELLATRTHLSEMHEKLIDDQHESAEDERLYEQAISDLNEKIDELERERDDLENRIKDVTNQSADTATMLEVYKKELQKASDRNAILESEKVRFDEERAYYLRLEAYHKQRLQSMGQKLQDARRETNMLHLEKRIQGFQTAIHTVQTSRNVKSHDKNLEELIRKLSNAMAEARQNINENPRKRPRDDEEQSERKMSRVEEREKREEILQLVNQLADRVGVTGNHTNPEEVRQLMEKVEIILREESTVEAPAVAGNNVEMEEETDGGTDGRDDGRKDGGTEPET